jgi:hypothetical protein
MLLKHGGIQGKAGRGERQLIRGLCPRNCVRRPRVRSGSLRRARALGGLLFGPLRVPGEAGHILEATASRRVEARDGTGTQRRLSSPWAGSAADLEAALRKVFAGSTPPSAIQSFGLRSERRRVDVPTLSGVDPGPGRFIKLQGGESSLPDTNRSGPATSRLGGKRFPGGCGKNTRWGKPPRLRSGLRRWVHTFSRGERWPGVDDRRKPKARVDRIPMRMSDL